MKGTRRLRAIWLQNRTWPLSIGLLLLLCAGLFWINQNRVAPQVAALEREFMVLQERSRQARQLRADAEQPQTFYQRGKDDLAAFRSLIPDRHAFTDLVGELFRLAERADLKITEVNYQPSELPEHGLLQYGLVFSVNGSYAQLKEFVALLEASKRLIAIEGIALRRDARAGGEASLRLELATYFKAGAA